MYGDFSEGSEKEGVREKDDYSGGSIPTLTCENAE